MINWNTVKKVLPAKECDWGEAVAYLWEGALKSAFKSTRYNITGSYFNKETKDHPAGGTLTVTVNDKMIASQDPNDIPQDIVNIINKYGWDIVDLPVSIIRTKAGNCRLKFFIFPINLDLDYYSNKYEKIIYPWR